MSTGIQRITAVGNAVVNGPATAAQLLSVAQAFAAQTDPDKIMAAFGVPAAQLSQEQMAQVFMWNLNQWIIQALKYQAEQAAVAAAQASIQAAGAAAISGIPAT